MDLVPLKDGRTSSYRPVNSGQVRQVRQTDAGKHEILDSASHSPKHTSGRRPYRLAWGALKVFRWSAYMKLT